MAPHAAAKLWKRSDDARLGAAYDPMAQDDGLYRRDDAALVEAKRFEAGYDDIPYLEPPQTMIEYDAGADREGRDPEDVWRTSSGYYRGDGYKRGVAAEADVEARQSDDGNWLYNEGFVGEPGWKREEAAEVGARQSEDGNWLYKEGFVGEPGWKREEAAPEAEVEGRQSEDGNWLYNEGFHGQPGWKREEPASADLIEARQSEDGNWLYNEGFVGEPGWKREEAAPGALVEKHTSDDNWLYNEGFVGDPNWKRNTNEDTPLAERNTIAMEDRLNEAYDPEHFKLAVHKRDPSDLFPLQSSNTLFQRAIPAAHYNPGQGSKNPNSFNNKGYFALFALIGVGMVLTSIWFFFWAKNGGFVWRKGDWDDYKSTVLRRKGPDGKTLSNATKTTKLGQQSIAGTFDLEKQGMHDARNYEDDRRKKHSRKQHGAGNREPSDDDVRAYRQEKPARVGGLNRHHDGSHWDSAGTSRSDLMSEASDRPLYPTIPPQSPKKKGFVEKKREQKQERKEMREAQKTKDALRNAGGPVPTSKPKRARRHSFSSIDDSVVDSSARYGNQTGDARSSYYDSYRRGHEPHRQPQRASYAAPPPAAKPSRMPKYPGSFDAYSDAGDSDTGTRVYSHHIPGVSRGGRDGGFRRDGRRDSYSS